MPINQTITALPPAPNWQGELPEVAEEKALNFTMALPPMRDELNNAFAQFNASEANINAKELSATNAEQTATAQAQQAANSQAAAALSKEAALASETGANASEVAARASATAASVAATAAVNAAKALDLPSDLNGAANLTLFVKGDETGYEMRPVMPIGTVIHKASATRPTGWLACNGAAVSRTQYAALFADIGTVYGAGNGSTTFNLPKLNDGRFIRSPGGNAAAAGVLQQDGIREIKGVMGFWHNRGSGASGALYLSGGGSNSETGGDGSGSNFAFSSDHGTTAQNPMAGRGALPEVRPLNMALYYFIYAGVE